MEAHCVLGEVRIQFLYIIKYCGNRAAVLWLRRLVKRYLATEVQVRFQASPCRICGRQSGTRTGFSPSISVFPRQYHSTHHRLNVVFTRRTNRRSLGTLLNVLGNQWTLDTKKKRRRRSIFKSRAILGKLTVRRPVKKSPTFYGTTMFVTVSTRARHLSLSRARLNPLYVFPPCFFKISFDIILSFTPRFSKLSLFFRFPHQTSCTFSPEQLLISSTTSYAI